MRPGEIVENYQGQFAKVIRRSEGGHTHLSAWVRTPELAEEEKVAVIALNAFGLSQVLKGGTETVEAGAGAGPKPLTEMKHAELKAYAKELGLSQAGKAEDLVARISEHLAKTVEEEMMDHVVTEDDLEANPELAEKGVKVGDTIKIPKAE